MRVVINTSPFQDAGFRISPELLQVIADAAQP